VPGPQTFYAAILRSSFAGLLTNNQLRIRPGVAMHGTRRTVLEAQANAADLPLVDCAAAVAVLERSL